MFYGAQQGIVDQLISWWFSTGGRSRRKGKKKKKKEDWIDPLRHDS